MKQILIFTLLIFCLGAPSVTHAQSTTWSQYYSEFTPKDDFLQKFSFPEPSGRQKSYSELKPKERRLVKNHLRVHYGVRPTRGGYLLGALQTTGQSIGRVAVYIVTMSAAAIVVGTLINQDPR